MIIKQKRFEDDPTPPAAASGRSFSNEQVF
jgi:hypothetical protein